MAAIGFGSIEYLHTVLAAWPAMRPGKPEKAAAFVLHLLGAGASYVNGQCLTVDGGYALA